MMSYMPSRAPFNHRSSPSDSGLSYPQGQASGDVHYAASGSGASDSFGNLAQYAPNPAYPPTTASWNNAQAASLPTRQSPHTPYAGSPAPQRPPTQAFPGAINRNGLLQIYSFGPDHGPAGTRVTVRALIHPSEPADPDRSVRILFEESPSMAERISRVEQGSMHFELWVRVPDIGSVPATLRMKAHLCSGLGTVLDAVEFGDFEYTRRG
ncbi:hypothetical protein CALVIDRAFT_267023 [Calocera viscosa TUFC12733]|uniref:Uncharacterized protein n=1 Tax=Calocera viscosa (strain TUFC12733) TaxID=1330018 RepID=A0A167IXT1_CALVF|nr:hypothetical protein CALVIDRAFT_267023 [Calocera viscosa TUFC12733]